MVFKGSGVALITPFKSQNVYEVDYDKLRELIDFHLNSKTDAIIICGTTGESATLSTEEKELIIEYTVKRVNKKVPVIVGTGSNNTLSALNQSKKAKELGADALLIVTPYYNKCTQQGLIDHYSIIAHYVNIPIIVYNVPSRTGVNIEPKTVLELSKIPNIVGIKEASGNLEQIKKIKELVGEDFAIYSGNDDQIYDVLNIGGDGVISVLANICPNGTHDICQEYFKGNIKHSYELQKIYTPLIDSLFCEVNPIPVKEACKILKLNNGGLRLPLTEASDETKLILKRNIDSIQ